MFSDSRTEIASLFWATRYRLDSALNRKPISILVVKLPSPERALVIVNSRDNFKKCHEAERCPRFNNNKPTLCSQKNVSF